MRKKILCCVKFACSSLPVFILAVFVSGCNLSENSRTIARAEKAWTISADSANAVLEVIKEPYVLNDKDFAHWCMLESRIADSLKKDLPPMHDLSRASEWYRKRGQTEDIARIKLYLGLSLIQDKESEQAMSVFLQALALVKNERYYDLAGTICSRIAGLYVNNNDIIAATKKYDEAAEYFRKGKNLRSYAIAYRDMGKTWAMRDSFDLALNCLIIADSIVAKLNDPKIYASILNHYGNSYSLQGNLKKAEYYLLAASACDTTNSFYNYNVLIDLYVREGQLTKARHLLDSLNALVLPAEYRSSIYYNYYLIHKEENNYPDALSNLEQFMDSSDQLLLEEKELNYIEMEKKYDQLKNYAEIQQLKIERQYYLIALVVLLIALLTGFLLFQKRQLFLKKKVIEQERALSDFNTRCYQLSLELERKRNELKASVSTQNDSSVIQKEMQLLQKELTDTKKKKLTGSAIGKKIIRLSSLAIPQNNNVLITRSMWLDIEKEVALIYPTFYRKLHDLLPDLNETDFRYCCLILFDLTSNQLAVLLNINPESVRKRHLRIRQKLGITLNQSTLYRYFVEFLLC